MCRPKNGFFKLTNSSTTFATKPVESEPLNDIRIPVFECERFDKDTDDFRKLFFYDKPSTSLHSPVRQRSGFLIQTLLLVYFDHK